MIGLVGLTCLFGDRSQVMVNYGDVVENLGHFAVQLQGLAVEVEGLAVVAIAGKYQSHVVEDKSPVVGVILQL